MSTTERFDNMEVYRQERSQAIEDFIERFADCEDRELLADMLVTVTRLARDGTGRGELKLVSNSLKELRYAFKIFAPYENIRKVSMFGSSRTPIDHPDYIQADLFARRMREENWMVITGAGDGIMRAGHDGAGREASFGVAIRLPFEQKTNTVIADDPKLVMFRYFFTRKLMFVKEASAIALFPGGFGTQDEGFEALTLVQTGKAEMVPIVMVDPPGGTYWKRWREFVVAELLNTNMISPEDMNLFLITDDAEEAVRDIVTFYKRYHSSRYVGDKLVMRIKQPLTDDTLQKLNDTYGNIMLNGQIEQSAGPVEGEEGELPELARLTLSFDRRSIGTLRLLINDINAGA